VVIGERGLKDGSVEVKWRREASARNLPLATAVEAILAELAGARAKHDAYCRQRIAARSGAATS
jgi:prolyl-tRNA synthetase